MKKSISLILVVAAVFAMSNQSHACHLTPIVDDANQLRSASWALNDHASSIESEIRFLQAHGVNPYQLKSEAREMRRAAKVLAQQSNQVAKLAFDLGYHRPNHSH